MTARIRVALAALAFSAVVFVVVVRAVSPGLMHDYEEQLVHDTFKLRNDPFNRPTHVAPALPGTFGERAEPFLIVLELSRKRIGKESRDQIELRRSIERGDKPTSAIGPEWKQELASTRDDL